MRTVRDKPLGLKDSLSVEDNAKAEFIMTNGAWIRDEEDTQLQLSALHLEATTLDVGSGLAQLYNENPGAIIKMSMPFVALLALGDTVFDVSVGAESREVIVIRGAVDFLYEATGRKDEMHEGFASIIADNGTTEPRNGTVGVRYDWNRLRADDWVSRLSAARSERHLWRLSAVKPTHYGDRPRPRLSARAGSLPLPQRGDHHPRDRFYHARRYRSYVMRTINRMVIVNKYWPTTIINTTVIQNFHKGRGRLSAYAGQIERKPHVLTHNRSRDNQRFVREAQQFNHQRIERDRERLTSASLLAAPKTEVRLSDARRPRPRY